MTRMILALIGSAAIAWPAFAAEKTVPEIASAGAEAYAAGDLVAAKIAFNRALNMVEAKKAELMLATMPEPLEGWAPTKNNGPSTAGERDGGAVAIRSYRGPDGVLKISLHSGTDTMRRESALLGNPALMRSLGHVHEVAGRQVVIKFDGSLRTLIGSGVMVEIEGRVPDAQKLAYFEALDLDRLEGF